MSNQKPSERINEIFKSRFMDGKYGWEAIVEYLDKEWQSKNCSACRGRKVKKSTCSCPVMD